MKLMTTVPAALAVCCLTTSSITAAPPPVQPPRPPATPPAQTEQPAATATYKVRLIDAGENPQVLRLKPAADLAQRTESNVSMTFTSMGMIMKSPTLHITNETALTAIDEESGDITYHFEITDAELVNAETANPMMVQQMRPAMAAMVGTEGDITIDARGLPHEAPETEAADMPGVDANSMAMGVALPEEPIGIGGSWEVTTQVQQQGFSVEQVATYEILSIDDQTIEVAMEVVQTAGEQEFSQHGMTMTLKQFTSSGSGTGTFRLDRLAPDKMDLKQSTTMVIAVDAGAMGAQEATQNIESSTTMVSEVIEKPADGG